MIPKKIIFFVKASHNADLSGKKFCELPSDLQSRILEYQFSVYLLPSYVDDQDIIQIFRRINSTSYSLNQQELRNATFFGEFKTSVYKLAAKQLKRWRRWRTFSESDITSVTSRLK